MKKLKSLLLNLLIPFALWGKTTISGNITDNNLGEALIGVNILIQGTTSSTTTDVLCLPK